MCRPSGMNHSLQGILSIMNLSSQGQAKSAHFCHIFQTLLIIKKLQKS